MTKFTNILSEHYLLGAILWDAEDNILRLRGEGITCEHFTTPYNKRIWNDAARFYDNDQVHSIEVMESEPEIMGSTEGRELAVHISQIRASYSGISHLPQHIKTIRGYRSMRMVYKASEDAMAMIESGSDAEVVLAHLRDKTAMATESLQSMKPWKDSKEVSNEMIEVIIKAQQDKGLSGESSGIDLIDFHTGGLEPEQLWVIAAPSSCGKTLLMIQIVAAFLKAKKKVLVFSFETGAGKIGIRLTSNSMSIDGKKLLGKGGLKLDKMDFNRVKLASDDIAKDNNITICDNFDLTLEAMLAITAMRIKMGHDVDLIAVDYIQLVPLTDVKAKNREQQVAEVSRGLKKLAKLAQCPVVTASQLNEQGQTRESKAITQDCDVLLNIDPEKDCIHLAKNRDAERGEMLKLRMNGKYQRFEQHYDNDLN